MTTKSGPAGVADVPRGPAHRKWGNTVDTTRIAQPHRENLDHQDERPHACNDGWITLGQIALDPETGEQVEEYALYLCRKCAERSQGVESADRAGVSFGVSRPSTQEEGGGP